MKFIKSSFLGLCILSGFLSTNTTFAVFNQNKSACPTDKDFRQLAEQAIQQSPRLVGISIAAYHPVCGKYSYTFGESNIASHTPMSVASKLPIASNTKPVLMALTFMILEENPDSFPQGLKTKLTDIRDHNGRAIFTADGKLLLPDGGQLDLVDSVLYKTLTGHSYNCKIDSVYQCPNLTEIDLHHLMLESSGLADYLRDSDLAHTNIPDIFKFFLAKLFSPLTDPGSNEYESDAEALHLFGIVKKANPDPAIPAQSHNTDASLLAIILERVSGNSLNALLTQKILNPLKIDANSIQFVSATPNADSTISRRYALLSTDEEIDAAVSSGEIFPILDKSLASKLKPSFLSGIGRRVYYFNMTQSAIDVLDLHSQGVLGFPGPSGIVARPDAYIKFYRALANHKLLNAQAQSQFESSFIPHSSSNKDYTIATGYASNDRMSWISSQKLPTFLTHCGFVPGGESVVMYNYETGFTVMIATNSSGSYRNTFPILFVKPTSYLDQAKISDLEMEYAKLFGVF